MFYVLAICCTTIIVQQYCKTILLNFIVQHCCTTKILLYNTVVQQCCTTLLALTLFEKIFLQNNCTEHCTILYQQKSGSVLSTEQSKNFKQST